MDTLAAQIHAPAAWIVTLAYLVFRPCVLWRLQICSRVRELLVMHVMQQQKENNREVMLSAMKLVALHSIVRLIFSVAPTTTYVWTLQLVVQLVQIVMLQQV